MGIQQREAELFSTRWNEGVGPLWQISSSLLLEITHDQAWVDYSFSNSPWGPLLCGKASAEGVANGISAKTLWIVSPETKPEILFSEGLGVFDALAREKGFTRWQWGGDEFHFVAGWPTAAREEVFFQVNRLGGSAAVDYIGDLQQPRISAFLEKHALEDSWVLQSVTGAEDEEALSGFLKDEFPGRWRREFLFWQSRKATSKCKWFILKNRHSGRMVGFVRVCMRGGSASFIDVPAALRLPMGEEGLAHTDSCLGPIGVSKHQRGLGLGNRILAAAIRELREWGARKLCIDWTDAYNFYEPLGLVAARSYRTLWSDL